jgi:hypothetical protein
VTIVDAFLRGPLTGTPANVEQVVAGFDGIAGGRVSATLSSSDRGVPSKAARNSAG